MNKYNNRKVGGFDSVKERRRYNELLLLQRAGKISDLQTQVKFELIPAQYETEERYGKSGKKLKDGKCLIERSLTYIADFVYKDNNGNTVVEDVKGYTNGTAYGLFACKRKLMLYLKGIKVKEI